MDNQETQQQDNIAEDAPLLNTQAQEETTTEEAPIRATEPSPDELATQEAEKDDELLERPDYFPQQFWDDEGPDVEKLAKSYNELRKQFSQGKHKAPENEYDIQNLVDQGADPEDALLAEYQVWAKENGVSQAAFENLAQKFLEMNGQVQETAERSRQEEMSKLGERAEEKIQMAERLLVKAPLTNNEREAMANSLNSAEAINAFLKYHQSLTNEGIPVKPMAEKPQMTQADLEAAIADPRWLTDAAYRTKFERQWEEANR